MANFNDLPQAVREKIYRMHLVDSTTTDLQQFRKVVELKFGAAYPRGRQARFMPPICQVSKKIEKEAAAIFYGENKFMFASLSSLGCFLAESVRRHHKSIRHIGFTYKGASYEGSDVLKRVARLKGLEVLTIRLNEREMVQDMVRRYSDGQEWIAHEGPTPQQQMRLLRFPAMSALLTISGLQKVELLKLHDTCSDEVDGPIPEGFFETHVRTQLTRVKKETTTSSPTPASFRFLDLPPELRNRVYDILLTVDGAVHPSKRDPTSKPRWSPEDEAGPRSALSILQVNKQIHGEADGIFYHRNKFVFYNPVQLQSFSTDIGALRSSMLRDLTIHYQNTKIAGIDLAEITLGHLKQLKGLRKLSVDISKIGDFNLPRLQQTHNAYWLRFANPGTLPGISRLFDLRGLEHILLRIPSVEEALDKLRQEKDHPFFKGNDVESKSKRGFARFGLALQHFNDALAEAQEGKVNRKLLEDNRWQTWDVFPTLEHDGIQDASAST